MAALSLRRGERQRSCGGPVFSTSSDSGSATGGPCIEYRTAGGSPLWRVVVGEPVVAAPSARHRSTSDRSAAALWSSLSGADQLSNRMAPHWAAARAGKLCLTPVLLALWDVRCVAPTMVGHGEQFKSQSLYYCMYVSIVTLVTILIYHAIFCVCVYVCTYCQTMSTSMALLIPYLN